MFSVSDDMSKLRADGGACFPRFPGRVGVGAIDAAAVWECDTSRDRVASSARVIATSAAAVSVCLYRNENDRDLAPGPGIVTVRTYSWC